MVRNKWDSRVIGSGNGLRKIIRIAMFFVCLLFLSACGTNEKAQNEDTGGTFDKSGTEMPELSFDGSETAQRNTWEKKVLVAYFSWADNAVQDNTDAMTSASVKSPGNVAQLAAWVAERTQGDLFSIKVAEPYPTDWDECLSRANQEKTDGIYPELLQDAEDVKDYDVVFLGFPNWWYSCPMAILSFIDGHDFSGKQVYLFCSHGTGGLARSVQDIKAALPDSDVSENVFDAYEEDTADSKDKVSDWLKEIGY